MKPARDLVERRQFLRFPSPKTEGTDLQRAASSDLLRASRPAMGSYFEVRIAATVPGALDLATRALDLIDALESQLSIYREDSDVSLLNASGHLGPVEVEPGLFDLLRQGLAIGEATRGAYDLTAGALSQAWGFVRGPRRVPSPEVFEEARARSGQQHVTLDLENRTVTFDRAGVVFNLGSIGKGYAIDRVADLIRSHWFPTGALIHGGRSSLFAVGSPPDDFGGRWEIALRNPFHPESPLGVLRLRNRGMGTSGTDFQRFEDRGRVYGHILDPRTGNPASGPAGVTVLAPTAAEADALSTAFYLLGPVASADYIRANPEVAALFVEGSPEDGPVTLVTIGIGPSDFQSTGAVRVAPIVP